ncbi:hypothetical protein LCGC14_0712950 [marine sediment metagenome]|uniref:Nucleotide modification associated domain-containing protein n=1 Tax=marine sediment metagenome TaxID=412755 RepID=A0A0F9QEK5_9ZZZZ
MTDTGKFRVGVPLAMCPRKGCLLRGGHGSEHRFVAGECPPDPPLTAHKPAIPVTKELCDDVCGSYTKGFSPPGTGDPGTIVSHSYRTQGRHGHPGFYQLLDEIADLHDRKNHDYAGQDPLSNLKLCEEFGIPAWKGVIVRLTDKWSRITQLITKEAQVKDESIEDTLKDNAVYSLLAIVLRRERKDL